MKNFSLAITALLLADLAFAQSACDIALKSGAFNTNDYAHSASILLKKRDDVCRSEYNSQQEAVNAAQNSGGSLGIGSFKLGLTDARQSSSGKWSVSDSRYCRASAEELDASASTTIRSQVTDMALKVWSECIASTAANRVYVRYQTNPDGQGMYGLIERYVGGAGGIGMIRGIASQNPVEDGRTLRCSIDGKAIPLNQDVNLQITKTPISIACSKPAEARKMIAVRTDQGDQNWIVMPSSKEQRQTSIDQLSAALLLLKAEVKKMAPASTVGAFNLAQCPEGWSRFEPAAGRFLLGSGAAGGLTPRSLGEKGGAETHTLTIEEMPVHRHQLPTFDAKSGTHEIGSGGHGEDWIPQEWSRETGGGKPHAIMPPFVVLTMCKKD